MNLKSLSVWLIYFASLTILSPSLSHAAHLVGFVSDRSAPELLGGAHQFLDNYPEHRITLRSTHQLAELTDSELKQLLGDADVFLMVGIFGEEVVRLESFLQKNELGKACHVIALNGDRRLTRLARVEGKRILEDLSVEELQEIHTNADSSTDAATLLKQKLKEFPEQAHWIEARAYWQSKGTDNVAEMFAYLLKHRATGLTPKPLRPQAAIRYFQKGNAISAADLDLKAGESVIAILDLNSGDSAGKRETLIDIEQQLATHGVNSFSVLARWGNSSVEALKKLEATAAPARIAGIIALQDFVIGGGSGRESSVEAFKALNVPVYKAIRMTETTEAQWRLSEAGLPWETIHYRIAMPEIQGISQPTVVAATSSPSIDSITGLRLVTTLSIDSQIESLAERVRNWNRLKHKANKDKKIALIYYNHPPGRHNIGADNLDVPASIWELLHDLKAAGYETGELPESPEELLDMLQEKGVNMPENYEQLAAYAKRVTTVRGEQYQAWFSELPEVIQQEMQFGALGYLDGVIRQAVESREISIGQKHLHAVIHDLEHFVEVVDHPARERALALIEQLEELYHETLEGNPRWDEAKKHIKALAGIGIEGLRGWGEAPGKVMVYDGELVLPGLRFGNIFVGPQPPRGWEVDEEILHANMAVPPPHQYLALYLWLKREFEADALVHLGRHSTYEFLPRHRTGLSEVDYPSIIAGNLPGVYPYIVDGVGEGIQAKRRGLAVMVDHLTPPLQTTPLYDELLQLRQLVESYEANEQAGNAPTQLRTGKAIREKVEVLNMQDELINELKKEHHLDDLTFANVDDDLLIHEIGHHLTEMQERFMPLGLHIFGRDWSQEAIETMLNSINPKGVPESTREALTVSPSHEKRAFLNALDAGYVLPGKGNDPVRTPEAMPTGRNFHALDSGLLPTKIAWDIAVQLNEQEKAKGNDPNESAAIVLWASDVVRDEGVMIALGMEMLGIQPQWNSRGIVKGLERLPLDPDSRPYRLDTVFTISGLFRDLYGQQVVWLDTAVLMALDGSSKTIAEKHPGLKAALEAALEPLGEAREPGSESLEHNIVAAHWAQSTLEQIEGDTPPGMAGTQAILRLFGAPPGGYGAGVNRIVERSGAWETRAEVAEVYLRGMGHTYGIEKEGAPAHSSFERQLAKVGQTYLGRASNLYGLMDNNDAFDYLGGLSMAIESIQGEAPNNNVIHHNNVNDLKIEPLERALLGELRGRFLNPAWLKPLMAHDYAGARTMGSEFLEYLWGWQVTNPEIVKTWVWDEVHDVYFKDRHGLGLDEFLEEGNNVHVKINMQAILLVAADKAFWEADPETLQQLSQEFTELVIEHGLPGSGHTRPDHPIFKSIMPRLSEDMQAALQAVLDKALPPESSEEEAEVPSTLAEIDTVDAPTRTEAAQPQEQTTEASIDQMTIRVAIGVLVALFLFGALRGRFLSGIKGK
ncbi:MAG: cobaltochelatase subunit CobN [Verrucomicrobiota bacterium]